MRNKLINNFPFIPTNDQMDVLDGVSRYLLIKDKISVFLLRGYAGTGKTSILAHIAHVYGEEKNVVLLAPTGRAARVLSSYCAMPAYTIHKRIYRLAEDGVGDMKFVLQRNNFVNTLFIVDEASMISTGNSYGRDILEDLMRFVYRGKGCKLIIAGDAAQLPPVELNESYALDSRFLNDKFNMPVMEFELSEVVRQESKSGILYNATKLRKLLQNNSSNVRFETHFGDFSAINGLELQEALEESVSEYGAEEVLIITRSNKRANLFNQEVRNRLLFREEEIEAGDILMGVKNNYFWLKEEKKVDFIANGESIEVLKVLSKESMYGYEFANLNVRFIDDRIPDVDVKVWLNGLLVEGPAMPRVDSENLYYSVLQDYIDQGEEKKAAVLAMNDPFYNALQCKFSYAVTCHKAQGGQWSTVFIDHGFLTEELVDENLIRWFYTAITRATSKVYLVNFNEMFLS